MLSFVDIWQFEEKNTAPYEKMLKCLQWCLNCFFVVRFEKNSVKSHIYYHSIHRKNLWQWSGCETTLHTHEHFKHDAHKYRNVVVTRSLLVSLHHVLKCMKKKEKKETQTTIESRHTQRLNIASSILWILPNQPLGPNSVWLETIHIHQTGRPTGRRKCWCLHENWVTVVYACTKSMTSTRPAQSWSIRMRMKWKWRNGKKLKITTLWLLSTHMNVFFLLLLNEIWSTTRCSQSVGNFEKKLRFSLRVRVCHKPPIEYFFFCMIWSTTWQRQRN